MHAEAFEACRQMFEEFGDGEGLGALDLGGQNWNGSVRSLLPLATWKGLDLVEGEGIDFVADAAKPPLDLGGEKFDIVVCTEVLEHEPNWQQIIRSACLALKDTGTFVVTCASLNRRPHGATGAHDPAPGEWYCNVDERDLRHELSLHFQEYDTLYNYPPGDAYGWGKGPLNA